MNTQRVLFFAGAAAVASAIALPGMLSAFNLLSPPVSLGLGTTGNGYQRDVHAIANTQQGSTVNSDQTPETTHPGVLGFGLTVWHALDAWASQTPSAARNFNFEWQGMSPTNPPSGNTIGFDPTAVSCNGGVLAYTQPGNSGWQMFMCDNVGYWGGPSGPGGGLFDAQGVMVHELGHALGLDHSTSTCGANCNTHTVMCAFICGNGVGARTIKVDDQSGLTAIYGTIPADKPVISSISGGAHLPLSQLTITGTNFAATVNVKFTAQASQNTGPITGVVYNVPTSGTSLTVTIPSEAISGNVLVWEPAISRLSNPFPITLADCAPPTNYCIAAPNSVNAGGATMGYSGSTSVTMNDGSLLAFGLPANVTNLFFMGQNQIAPVAFGNGFRCIGAPFVRLPAVQSGIFGDTQYDLDLTNLPQGTQVLAGQTWNFQNWYRDPAAGGANYNASDALSVIYCP